MGELILEFFVYIFIEILFHYTGAFIRWIFLFRKYTFEQIAENKTKNMLGYNELVGMIFIFILAILFIYLF